MDKSREQFLEWFSKEYEEVNNSTELSAQVIKMIASAAWQASRADIEIELLADKRRMDWLVSKAVNVRDPMVYGSHSMFWSQVITDEEDDYYETKLREQIDAAMDAEAIRAAGLKVKGE
ncbi:hypothetical protein [Cronobacter sakazakii]|uniref:hypothetical protein n=1 Tax=Cronobacter sakazakii TaxID=28141 RepID=UPI000B0629CA|nr:hypothetical protein [Cronobacter sakazakii]MEB8566207.1 hypothetical protein [Cronobacter sakazakii]